MTPYLTPLKAAAFALCIALFACNAPTESTLPTSSGFSPEGGPVYFGSEASVQLVKDIDAAWAAEDMEQLASFFADTCVFDWHDGNRYEGPEAFIGRIMADTLDHDWTFNWAYAVDANLEEAGDWVHAGFDVKTKGQCTRGARLVPRVVLHRRRKGPLLVQHEGHPAQLENHGQHGPSNQEAASYESAQCVDE